MSRPTRKPPAKPIPSARTEWLRRVAVLAFPSALFLGAGFRLFVSTGRDDAHITYWPAYTLARFGEILNYNGERVEQSSSLLHVLLLGALRKLTGADVVTLGKLSSIVAGVGTLLLVYALSRKMADRTTAFAGTFLAAACAYFVYWSFGGLETTIVSLVGVWMILAFGRHLTRTPAPSLIGSVLPMIAFALVRPESPFVLIGMLLAAILVLSLPRFRADAVHTRTMRARLPALLAAAAVIFGVLVAFRCFYFGSAFPQPVEAKYAGFSAASFTNGLRYLAANVFQQGIAIAVSLVTSAIACISLAIVEWRAKHFAPHTAFALLFVAGYLAFIVMSGGDWMEGGRFLVFFLPIALAFIPVAMAKIIQGRRRRRLLVALSITALALLEMESLLSFARRESVGTLHWRDMEVAQETHIRGYSWFEKHNRVNMRDVPTIEFLDEFIPQVEAIRTRKIILMTGQMGMIPYHVSKKYFGRVQFVDRRGLCDRMLTSCDVSRLLTRDARGLHLEYIDYFEIRDQIEHACGVPRPDIIFDIRGGNTQIVGEHGYLIVARQYGTISDKRGAGGEVLATGFVAIPEGLWAELGWDAIRRKAAKDSSLAR